MEMAQHLRTLQGITVHHHLELYFREVDAHCGLQGLLRARSAHTDSGVYTLIFERNESMHVE